MFFFDCARISLNHLKFFTSQSMSSTLPSFSEETEINDNELDQEPPQMKFYATGDDGNVVQLHKRMASVPISFGGKQFQEALEEVLI